MPAHRAGRTPPIDEQKMLIIPAADSSPICVGRVPLNFLFDSSSPRSGDAHALDAHSPGIVPAHIGDGHHERNRACAPLLARPLRRQRAAHPAAPATGAAHMDRRPRRPSSSVGYDLFSQVNVSAVRASTLNADSDLCDLQ